MENPEIQFKRYKPDYTGMRVQEIPYGTLPDVSGAQAVYMYDLILPETAPEHPMPIVFFIHGGGFLPPCDRKQAYISTFARHLTGAGYAVVSPDYPLFRDSEQYAALGERAAYPLAGAAIHACYQSLSEQASSLGLDASRFAIMGGSAGAMTAFYAIAQHDDAYRAFINLWGVPETLPDLKHFPPTLSVHGTADKLVPYAREAAVQEQLARYGVRHKLISLEGMDHTPLGQMDQYLPEILQLLHETLHESM